MKHLFLLLVFTFPALMATSQTWNFVGSPAGYGATEVDIEVTPNGQLLMAYIDSDNSGKATVRKFVNGSWQLVGTAGITSTNCFDLQLVASGENPAIAVKHLTTLGATTYEFLEIYKWSGTAWVAQSPGGYPWTEHNYDYSLRANSTGTLFLTYYNLDYQTHDEGMITVNLSTQQQIGTIVNEWDTDFYGMGTYAGVGNDVKVALCELADMDYATELRSFSAGEWDGPLLSYGEQMNKIKVEKASVNYGIFYKTSSPTSLKFIAANGSTPGTALSMPTSSAVTDFDFDIYSDDAYVFYRSNTTCYFKKVTTALSPAQTAISSGTALAPNNSTSLATETYSGIHVIAYVSGTNCYVKEYNLDANIDDNDLLTMCEGTLFNNGLEPVIYCLDPNFDQSNLQMTCTSQNTSIIPQSAISVTGSGTTSFGLQITGTNDVTASTVVDLKWVLIDNGIHVDSILLPITINPKPNIQFTFPNATLCENAAIVNLLNKATPAGGTWSGTGVQGNTFNPAYMQPVSSPVSTTLTYSKTNLYGCTASDNMNITIVPSPILNVTTTSADCDEANGTAAVAITEGQSPYLVYWSSGSTQTSVTGLNSGQYYIAVHDDNGCSATQSVLIANTGTTQTGVVTNVACAGGATGAIDVTVTGGSGAFTYSWSNGATTQDLSNVPAGPYEVTITDGEGCVSTASYTVTQPQALIIEDLGNSPATCDESDGVASVTYTGGTMPYTYVWEDSDGNDLGINSSLLEDAYAGAYVNTVTDANGCTFTTSVMVSNVNGPVVAIDTIITSSCDNDGAIALINISGNAQTFNWSNGETTPNIGGLSPGTYTVEATGSNGCVTMLSAVVESTPPVAVEICLLTVDTLTNTNLVVWEKPITNGIDHFNIYRETSQAGLYQLAGQVDYDDESTYNDLVASPSVRSWRYKISSVDACGVESELSESHKTIHLAINLGLGSTINLSWDSYEGFVFPNYAIRRYTNLNGWETIQTMPVNLFSFTDTPPSTEGLVYLVTIDSPTECNATKTTTDFNSSRSNKDNRLSIASPTSSLNELLAGSMQLYPNPSTGAVTFENKSGVPVEAAIFDASGRLLVTISVPVGSVQSQLDFLSNGLYQVVFTGGNAHATQKLTIQH